MSFQEMWPEGCWACRGNNWWTGSWTPGKGNRQAEEGGVSGLLIPEAADRYRVVKRAAELVWEEFSEAMKKDF